MHIRTLMGRFHYNFWEGKHVDRVLELMQSDAEITVDTGDGDMCFHAPDFVNDTLIMGECLPKWTVVSGKYSDDYEMNAIIYIRTDRGVQYERVVTSFCISDDSHKFCCIHMKIIPINSPLTEPDAWQDDIALPKPFMLD